MKLRDGLFIVLLVLITGLVYQKIYLNGFLFDDQLSYFKSPEINAFERLSKMYFSPTNDFYEKTPAEYIEAGQIPWWSHPDIHNKSFRPIAGAFRLLDDVLFYSDARLNYLHSVFWLFLGSLSFFYLLKNLEMSSPILYFGTLFFSFHPIFSTPVSFINNRNILISLFFAILCILCFVKFLKNEARKNIYLNCSFILFILAVLSTEQFIALSALYFVNYKNLKNSKYIHFMMTIFAVLWIIYRSVFDYDYRNSASLYSPYSQTFNWLAEFLKYSFQAPLYWISGKTFSIFELFAASLLILFTYIAVQKTQFKMKVFFPEFHWFICAYCGLLSAAAGVFNPRYLALFHLFFSIGALLQIDKACKLINCRSLKIFSFFCITVCTITFATFFKNLDNLKAAWLNSVLRPTQKLVKYCDRNRFLAVNSPNPYLFLYYAKTGQISDSCLKKIVFFAESFSQVKFSSEKNYFILESDSLVSAQFNYFRDFQKNPHLKVGDIVKLANVSVSVLALTDSGSPKKIKIEYDYDAFSKSGFKSDEQPVIFVDLNSDLI